MLRLSAICFCMIILCTASSFGADNIHTMVFRGSAIDLGDTTRLTGPSDGQVTHAVISPNGRYVAYSNSIEIVVDDLSSESYKSDSNIERLSVIPTSGGRPVVLLEDRSGLIIEDQELENPTWFFVHTFTWSPDSKLLAVPVVQIKPGLSEEEFLLIMTPKGELVKQLSVPFCSLISSDSNGFYWSPDSSQLTWVFMDYDETVEANKAKIITFNVGTGKHRIIAELPQQETNSRLRLIGWSSNSSLMCMAYKGSNARMEEVWEYYLDGREPKLLGDVQQWNEVSPDGVFVLTLRGQGSKVKTLAGEDVRSIGNDSDWPVGWTPMSGLFCCGRREYIKDPAGAREKELHTLWLASVEKHALNNMLIAIDSDPFVMPSWTSDCSKVAYACDYMLYVSELIWREPTAFEKASAGIRLSEEEEQEILLNNGKEIAIAFFMYNNDWDEKFPNSQTVQDDLLPYLKIKNVFSRPGTDQVIFNYYPQPNLDDIPEPQDTILGTLDAGYSWQVAIFADGHVEVADKN
ncbi:MAG TPA: hypothetical protein PLP86_00375 [Armatimonadota bacterium]|nr:hypothetical protein [Armatimonadota bacterium]